jgi:GT2 family glycosyltransferase
VFTRGPERSTQFNYGFTQSKGEYIYRIGLEFVLEPDLVEKCVAKMAEGFDALALHNRSVGDSIWAKVRYLERESYKNDNSIVAVRFMKRDVFAAVGMFDESLVAGEDFDLHNRIVDAGYKWSHVDAVESHIGEPKTIGEVWHKFYYYGRTIRRYQQKSGARGQQQLGFFRPSFKKLQKDLLKQPHLFIAFWYYMIVKYAAGACGVLRGAPTSLKPTTKP